VPLGILIRDFAPADLLAAMPPRPGVAALGWPGFLWSLVPVTIGNAIGGGVLVGGVYWFAYLRPRPAPGR
jgi:formate/nitrite transporter FocA (FNT family)